MRQASAVRIVGLVLLLVLFAGCEGNVLLPGGTRASWRYVEDGWGGLATGAPRFSGRLLLLPIRLGIHPAERVDSAICIASLRAKVRGTWIVVRLHKGLCGQGSVTKLETALPRPTAGLYTVVYDDMLAGYPRIGEVRVP
jgi:hypothetical protein